ncbi:suppressor of stem-loop protein 1 [Rhizoctonia solani]|uniref:Suppressor of stem-loop protein 1 n=1 Tax=Rhizoctonia solani TaxID=456999 RepID=A0A8H8SXG8_9AGAM|nr:suppressor of stem-loop protein 1 [Rhizoctonia solani]QRW21489.1 suppressor of stem-loop protein 1 [Rhizoctonia solani]
MAPRDDVSSGSEAGMEEDSDVEYTEKNNGAVDDGEKGKGKQKEKKGKNKAKDQGYSWEANYVRSWDQVQEDEGGRGGKGPSSAIRRAIIRHLVLLIDLSAAMADRDLRPTRFELALDCARAFVVEWCEQNPLGQIGVVGMRAGIGERIVEMTGNPHDVLRAIADKRKLEPAGEPSLQNAIEVARAGMRHSFTDTLVERDCDNLCCVKDKIRISLVALAAEMKICKELCEKTEGSFGVALNEGHFKDLLFEHIPPPAHRAARTGNDKIPSSQTGKANPLNPNADLMLMGFPTRLPPTSAPALCVCHPSRMRAEGFLCPRCSAKLCEVPTDCDVCGLMVVSSPHLARSYHHLFPVGAYTAINEIGPDDTPSATCQGCTTPFRTDAPHSVPAGANDGISHLGRYRCPKCKNDFCDECDVFIHESLHKTSPKNGPVDRDVTVCRSKSLRLVSARRPTRQGNDLETRACRHCAAGQRELRQDFRTGVGNCVEYGSGLGRIMNKGQRTFSQRRRRPTRIWIRTTLVSPLPLVAHLSPFSTLVLSTTMIARTLALALGAVLPLVAFAGNVTEGGSCSQSNTYLTPGSYQLNTDCDSRTYCNSGGTCAKKQCRKDEFPFGYNDVAFKDLPKMCPSGQFCPDEEDDCQNVLSVGSSCQLNRDDECEPAPDTSLSTPDNHRGAICLNYQCMWQNVTVGQPCVVENIAYIAYSTEGEFINIVSRGNCRHGLYCDAAQKICIATQDFGAACTADKECTSGNCLDNLTCGVSTDAPRKLGAWVYAVVAIAIVGGMLLTVGTLFMIHRKERDEMRQQREQYWREQAALRQNILQMRETAQASLLSLPYNGQNQSGSGYNSPSRHSSLASGKEMGIQSDDSHAGFVTNAGYAGGKGTSGLRNSLRSDDGQEATETMSMDALVTERDNGSNGRRRKGGLSIGGKR